MSVPAASSRVVAVATLAVTAALLAATAAMWLSSWIWVIGLVPTVTLLPLLFPDGRFSARRRFVALLATAATLGIAVTPGLGTEHRPR